MKKIIYSLVLFVALSVPIYAADVGTCVETLEGNPGDRVRILKVDCTAAAGDIVRTLTNSVNLQAHMLMQVDVTPIVLPTAASDLYLYNARSVKVTGEDLADKVTTTGTINFLATGNPIMWGSWVLDVDNNAVAGARVIFELYFYKL